MKTGKRNDRIFNFTATAMFGFIALFTILSGSAAIAADAQLRVEKQPFNSIAYGTTQRITIMSSDDDPISISKVDVNRGRCPTNRPWDRSGKPTTLQFSDSYRLFTDANCNVIEITIHTDRGVFTAKF